MHWPFKQHKTSRNVKTLPYHNDLKSFGACFGVSGGYERPMWYAIKEQKPEYEYSYNHQNWYPAVEYETKNTRENVGLFDLTAFSKYDLIVMISSSFFSSTVVDKTRQKSRLRKFPESSLSGPQNDHFLESSQNSKKK